MGSFGFSIVDILIVVVILLSLIVGWIRGATKEILSIIAWGGSIYLTILIFPQIKDIARSKISHGLIADFLTICILFIIFLAFLSIVSYLCSNFIKKSMLNTTDKALGGIFGIFRGVVILAVIDFFVVQCLINDTPKIILESNLRPYVSNISNYMLLILPDSVQEKLISHLSQSKRQGILDFLKDGIFDQVELNLPDIVETAKPLDDEFMIEKEPDEIQDIAEPKEHPQSAEDLSTLRPRKNSQTKIKKSEYQEKKERQDMDRLLDQYDDVDED